AGSRSCPPAVSPRSALATVAVTTAATVPLTERLVTEAGDRALGSRRRLSARCGRPERDADDAVHNLLLPELCVDEAEIDSRGDEAAFMLLLHFFDARALDLEMPDAAVELRH